MECSCESINMMNCLQGYAVITPESNINITLLVQGVW